MLEKFVCLGFVLAVPLSASAGHQECGRKKVAATVRSCPDGSIPAYVADEIQPDPPAQPVAPVRPAPASPAPQPSGPTASERAPAGASATTLDFFFGVWRTRIPGAVWTSPSGYDGYDWLHVAAGVSVGDLIIRPDGTYVWNSYGGKSGRWERGDSAEWPIVLIDTVENRARGAARGAAAAARAASSPPRLLTAGPRRGTGPGGTGRACTRSHGRRE